MDKLIIKKREKGKDTVTRTIRMSGETFDRITALADENDVTFNNAVNQILLFGLQRAEKK